jgi:hypothetical protein
VKRAAIIVLLAAGVAQAQSTPINVQRVADDAIVFDRVADASKRDLPRDLLKRIVLEDIELLRGRRSDGTYQYARYERIEASRVDESFSINPRENDDNLQKVELSAPFAYRLIVSSPSRRMLVTKNRRIWVDRVDLEYIAEGSTTARTQSVKIEQWLEPGTVKPVDFPAIARQATARVYARGDKESGYGNLELTLIQARVVDEPDSPYADAVASAKAVQRALDNNDIPSLRAMANRMRDSLRMAGVAPLTSVAPAPSRTTLDVVASQDAVPSSELYGELQQIEDLLTGTADERREGVDRLHQLTRRLRPSNGSPR